MRRWSTRTHVISPTLVNEASLQLQRKSHCDFCLWVWSPRLPISPSTATLTGRTPKTVFPSILLFGSTGSPIHAPVSPLGETQRTATSFGMMFPGPGEDTSSRWAAAGCFTRRCRIGLRPPRAVSSFTGFYTGNDFADYLLGYATSYRSQRSKAPATGTTFPLPCISRTTGA